MECSSIRTALPAAKAIAPPEPPSPMIAAIKGTRRSRHVSIARAIVTDPYLIVADEPTGDLDRKSADEILGLLELLNQEFHKTVIMVTHDQKAAQHASRILYLDKGKLVSDDSRPRIGAAS